MKKNNNTKNNNRKSKKQMKMAYGVAHRIARWMGRGDGYMIDYIGHNDFYPNVIADSAHYTKSSIDLVEQTPNLVLFISHDGWLVRRNKAAISDGVESIEIIFNEDETNSRSEAFRRTIDLVKEAVDKLNKKFPQEDFLAQPSKAAEKPKVLVFADFPLLAAQVLVDGCPQVDCYYADNSFYPKGHLGIRMCVAAYEASQGISAEKDSWERMGAKLWKKPKVWADVVNF